ncbi:long-chain-fatty-acid--CoA ligase [Kordiimonas aquimaris]|uniref:long-chain-fatty-acid--CoA ligase n=1 Tax=Kordiimonas aquimaris TaxID=707591 RepID=UPI0021D33C55|nr:long-chain fatty acid--CoA ligase [Kordiimonas aquimaris]
MPIAYQHEISFNADNLLSNHLGSLVDESVKNHGGKKAFSCILPTGHSQTMTFHELGTHSDAVAAYLREELNLQTGDVVAVQSPNTLAYPVLICGILKAGLTITNVNPLYTADETNHQLKDSGAKIWFVIDVFGDRVKQSTENTNVEQVYCLSLLDFFPSLQRHMLGFAMKYIKKAIPAFEGEAAGSMRTVIDTGMKHLKRVGDTSKYREGQSVFDPAIYQYTGGTTGRSKGAVLTHYNVVGNMSQADMRPDKLDIRLEDALLLILPLYHVYALAVGALACMNNGVHVVLVPVPRPLSNLKAAFDKFDITILPGINTLYTGLMQEKWFTDSPPKSLRACYSGAAPLQPATANAWHDLTGLEIYEGYGMTECTCVVSSMPLNRPPKRGTCGVPVPGTDLRIVDSEGNDLPVGEAGELLVRGPQVMSGYLNNPDATDEALTDGWLRTGDVGKLDEEGYLSIVDRIKDMIIVSGFNVFPVDIEDVLTKYDAVREAAVVGAKHETTGEKVVAYIVPANDTLTTDMVTAHCREHLTGYKVPKTIHFVEELPKSPVGKVLRRELRVMANTD